MKKILSAFIAVFATVFCFSACDSINNLLGNRNDSSISESLNHSNVLSPDDGENKTPDDGDKTPGGDETMPDDGDKTPDGDETMPDDDDKTPSGDDTTSGDEDKTPGGDDTTSGDESSYRYTDFTAAEKALFLQYIGEVIPFLPNDEYYLEGYNEIDDYENGMWYCVVDVTNMGFALYRGMYSDYVFVEDYVDEEGDRWYCYEKGDIYVEMVYYYDGYDMCIQVYVSLSSTSDDDVGGGSGGNVGGDAGEDVGGGGSGDLEDGIELLPNHGKGLPNGIDGVYEVDFTKGTPVKDVHDQGYYSDGCPTKGDVNVLVIPVEFNDVKAASKGYTVEKIDRAFNGVAGTTDYHSVSEYYSISSYGQLDLNFVVLEDWFCPQYNSNYYKTETDEEGQAIGDQLIIDEALASLENEMDLTVFDSDGNMVIDAIVLINTLDIDSDEDFYWAYRYWNTYADEDGYYYEYDGVSANDYLWAPYQFLHETYDEYGEVEYDEDVMNTYTFIHEFGHVLGADDYYDTAYVGAPLEGYDVMDSMMGDHNAYTKFNYGWITNSRLVVAEESVTLTLEDFSKTGDTILIANNWDEKLGAYQEYFLVVYYTNNGLNGGDYGYFDEEGIVVYHVNATLYKEVYGETTYYDVYYNNTDASDEYGTENNLIELVKSADGNYVFEEYDSLLASEKTDDGQKIAYVLTVNRITEDSATVTFHKNA